MMSLLIEQLKTRNMDLKKAEIEGVLYEIKNNKSLDNSKLIRITGLPKETLNSFLRSISNILEKSTDGSISFNAEGIKAVSDVKLMPYMWRIYSPSEPKIEDKLIQFRKEFDIQPKREFDQFFATPKSTVKKYNMLKSKALIERKNILLLGDDDLVSVAIALSGLNYSQITVLDIDDRILSTIENIFDKKGFKNLKTDLYDVRNPLKKEYFGRFDVVLIDPPYTSSGVRLFLNRAIQMLKRDDTFEGKYVLLHYGNSFKTPEKTLKIQEIINDFGLVIEDKINKYTQYYGAQAIGSNSSLYVLKATSGSFYLEEDELDEHIYTHE